MTTLVTRTTSAPRVEPGPDLLEVTYPKGRRCVDPDCITLLCYLNPGPRCFLHTQKHAAELVQASSAQAA